MTQPAAPNRWLVPPAAVAIHLCIGQAYALSVFNLPLTRAIGITESAPDDWKLTDLGWIFSLAMFFLGASAAVFGRWVERVGPRVSGSVAAVCWGGGFMVAAAGIHFHNIWLLYLGYGVLGGCGLGIGYITPVSTLVKWFPDRRGMATGMAIMGFGGGAMVATPLSRLLMDTFATTDSVGVWQTFLTMGAGYFAIMLAAAACMRVPPAGWKPQGWEPPIGSAGANDSLGADAAIRTKPFWLLWMVLLLNVTAGIGVLGQASPMIQEVFPGRVSVDDAYAFVFLLSLFNLMGRFAWASVSDRLGRKATYTCFFALGIALYAAAPFAGTAGNIPLFVGCFAIILSMYGGGFATIPAYLSDLFGTKYVGAIHGRLLTAWSVAGILGPVLVNYIRQYQIDSGVEKAQAYNITMWLMTALLAGGLICNWAVGSPAQRVAFPVEPTKP